ARNHLENSVDHPWLTIFFHWGLSLLKLSDDSCWACTGAGAGAWVFGGIVPFISPSLKHPRSKRRWNDASMTSSVRANLRSRARVPARIFNLIHPLSVKSQLRAFSVSQKEICKFRYASTDIRSAVSGKFPIPKSTGTADGRALFNCSIGKEKNERTF